MSPGGRTVPGENRNQVVWFGLVGLANTVVGYATIVLFMEGMDWSPFLSNAMGYAVGLTMGFALNRALTFRGVGSNHGTFYKYVLAFIASYGFNLVVLWGSMTLFADMRLVAQLLAMVGYSVLFFLLCKFYVFR